MKQEEELEDTNGVIRIHTKKDKMTNNDLQIINLWIKVMRRKHYSNVTIG
jgi:hypothetical protein